MYNDHYALAFNPFDKQQLPEKDCFRSRDFNEMTSRLDYLKDTRGIGLFTASPGMGKTYALRCFSKSLNPNLYHMEYICLSTVSVAEFYKQLCAILGVSSKGGKPGMFRAIQDQVWYLYHEKRQPLLLCCRRSPVPFHRDPERPEDDPELRLRFRELLHAHPLRGIPSERHAEPAHA